MENADNLCTALIVRLDRLAPCRVVGVTPEGGVYTLARHRDNGEPAGVCFSPDGLGLPNATPVRRTP